NAKNSSAITSFSFQRASAVTTIPPMTSVATAARFAVSAIPEEFSPLRRILQTHGHVPARAGPPRGTASRRRPRRAVRAGAAAGGPGGTRRGGRLARDRARGGAAGGRRRRRPARRLAVGADARRADDGE